VKKKSAGRLIFRILIVLLVVYLLWLGWLLLRFRPHHRVILPGRAGPPFEVVGTYHIHSNLSDGLKQPDKIASIAARQSLDFIILTDHGSPNFASLASQGWKNGVLLLAGSELSTNRGHMVALGFTTPRQSFAQNAERAARQIAAAGGFSIIAHPFSKTQWSWGKLIEYQGIEIIDSDTMMKKHVFTALPYLPTLLVNPRLFLLKTLERPSQTLRKWDELNESVLLSSYFSTDAHLFYSALFSCFRLHVLLDQPLAKDFDAARSQVFGALRARKFYNAIDAARPAAGFRFYAVTESAGVNSRKDVRFDRASPPALRVEASFPFTTEIRLLRNGKEIMRSGEQELNFQATESGAYRVEVYLRDWSPLASDIPWIVSNLIYLREGEE
jgi:hypothetical protein